MVIIMNLTFVEARPPFKLLTTKQSQYIPHYKDCVNIGDNKIYEVAGVVHDYSHGYQSIIIYLEIKGVLPSENM